jgi:hypothetical protein
MFKEVLPNCTAPLTAAHCARAPAERAPGGGGGAAPGDLWCSVVDYNAAPGGPSPAPPLALPPWPEYSDGDDGGGGGGWEEDAHLSPPLQPRQVEQADSDAALHPPPPPPRRTRRVNYYSSDMKRRAWQLMQLWLSQRGLLTILRCEPDGIHYDCSAVFDDHGRDVRAFIFSGLKQEFPQQERSQSDTLPTLARFATVLARWFSAVDSSKKINWRRARAPAGADTQLLPIAAPAPLAPLAPTHSSSSAAGSV